MTCPARRSRTNRALRSSVRSRIPWVRGAQTVPRRRTPGRCGTVTHLLPTTKRSKRIDYYRAKGEGPKGVGAFSCRLVLICDIRMRGSRPAVPRSQRRDSTASARSGARSARSAGGRPSQNWRLILVDDPAVKSRLGPLYREGIAALWDTAHADRLARARATPRRSG